MRFADSMLVSLREAYLIGSGLETLEVAAVPPIRLRGVIRRFILLNGVLILLFRLSLLVYFNKNWDSVGRPRLLYGEVIIDLQIFAARRA